MFNHRTSVAVMLWLSSFAASAAQQTLSEPPAMDYGRTIEQSDMVFVPYVGMQHGPIYYTRYAQSPTTVGTSGDLRRLSVYLRPTAHIEGVYNGFLSTHGISDARVIPVPAFGSCQPTQEIKDLLDFLPDFRKPAIMAGSYPNICALSLYFPPTMEQQVKDIIAARPVITMQASIPMCDPTAPLMDVAAINQQLVAAGVLEVTSAGDVTGNYWSVVFEATRLALLNPSLFVTADARVGWEVYMKLFQVDSATETATMPVAAQAPHYVCSPEPLNIQFGLAVP